MCDVCFEGEGRKVVAQSEHQRNDHLNSKKHKNNCEKRRGEGVVASDVLRGEEGDDFGDLMIRFVC